MYHTFNNTWCVSTKLYDISILPFYLSPWNERTLPIMKTISALPYMLCRWPHSANVHIWSRISQTTFSTFPIHVCWEQDQFYHVKWLLLLVTAKSVFYSTVAICLALVAHRWSCLTHKFGSCCAYCSGEKFFYWYLPALSVSLGLHINTRLYQWQLELSCLQVWWWHHSGNIQDLDQLPVDDNDEKSQLNLSIALLCSELVSVESIGYWLHVLIRYLCVK